MSRTKRRHTKTTSRSPPIIYPAARRWWSWLVCRWFSAGICKQLSFIPLEGTQQSNSHVILTRENDRRTSKHTREPQSVLTSVISSQYKQNPQPAGDINGIRMLNGFRFKSSTLNANPLLNTANPEGWRIYDGHFNPQRGRIIDDHRHIERRYHVFLWNSVEKIPTFCTVIFHIPASMILFPTKITFFAHFVLLFPSVDSLFVTQSGQPFTYKIIIISQKIKGDTKIHV